MHLLPAGACRSTKIRQLLLVMQLTAFILIIGCLSVSAKSLSQITLKETNAPLQRVFEQIHKQSGYDIIYNGELVREAGTVTISLQNATLREALDACLANKPLKYRIDEQTVIINRKIESTLPISGIVKGVDGKPLANVSVVVKGTDKGTTTDAEGKFNIDVNPGEVLVVSSVGFGSKEVKVNTANRDLVIALDISSSPLDEVQIIAYGTTTRRFSTGNIGSVKNDEIAKQPINNPLLALQGRVPGLFIEQATGLPGSGIKVRIQGQTSLNKGSDPLYVIDGVPYISQMLPTLNSILGNSGNTVGTIATGSGNPLSFLNPFDIESVEILKDADATSIYGSRAAAGAILITTKKGMPGKTKVGINVQSGWGKLARRLDLLNTTQYLAMRHEAKANDHLGIEPTDYDINGMWDTTRYTDWQKELIGGSAKYTDVQASVSGGTTNTNFLVGVGLHKETTVFPGDFSDRKGSLHFNLNNTSANKKFTFNLSGSYLLDNNQLPAMDLTTQARSFAPNAPSLRSEDGSINWAQDSTGNTTFFNPLGELNKRYKIETRNLIGNMMLGYEVLPGLEISTSLGYTNLQSDEIVTTPVTYYRPEIRPQFGNLLRRAQYGNNNISTWIAEPQISYKKTIGNGKMEALLGTTFHDINSSGQQLTGSTYNSDLVLEDIRSAASVKVDNSVRSTYRYNALFARLGYTWDRKYIINVTARRDGSSRFGSANLFNNFGAVAGAWIFSDENFFKQTIPLISFGKLRLSYGTTGNDQIGDYQFLNLYNPIGVSVPYQQSVGLEPIGLPNPYLQWEETKKLQGGIELGFWNDRILLSAGYYHNRSSNQLLDYVLSIFTGFSSIPQNFPATIQNTGWELSLNTVNVRSSTFNWSSSINVTMPKNKLVSFPGLEQSSYATQVIVGEPFTIKKVYRFAGVDAATGVYQFYDAEGKLTTTPDPSNDATKLINTTPEFFGGFQNSVSYKKIALSFLFQFVKQKGQNYALGGIPPGVYHNNQPVTVLDRWQNAGDDKPIQRFNSDFSLYQSLNDALSSDAGFTDASYVRLKNISLSWELPGKWTNRARLENVSIYAQGQNLLTFTGYDGYDPENRSTESIPPLRIITFGVRLTL